MAFDTMFLKAMTNEIKKSSTGGRILKIHQPFPHELFFHIRTNRCNKRLLLSAHPSYARVQWTSDVPENPEKPPMFCMLLRKYLEGALIEAVEQIPLERVLRFRIRGKDDIGISHYHDLYVEIMGRHSNITLVDPEKNTIIDCIKHVPKSQNRYRTLLPGALYLLPPQAEKIDPFCVTSSEVNKVIDFSTPDLKKQLITQFAGFSSVVAEEIVEKSKNVPADKFGEAFVTTMQDINHYALESKPIMWRKEEKEGYYFMPLYVAGGSVTHFPSLSELLDQFYRGKAGRDRTHQVSHDLKRLLANEKARNLLKIEKLKATLEESKRADEYRIKGELLTANLHRTEKGAANLTVQNFYDENLPEITISLDPNKSPSQNAQSYFTQYQKRRNAAHYVNEQISLAQKEIDYIESLQSQLETAAPFDVEEIRQELAEEGYIRYKPKKNDKKKKTFPKLEKYLSSTGLTILVGKNNKQNEYLTNKLAKNNEMWFHVKDLPGSHVVLQSANPDETSVCEAATLAAYFSKARLSKNVPVDATLIKHVKKPNGAKPGYVIYENQTTYYTTPEERIVKQLKVR